ncbi:hypothetical protein FHS82_000747 [Pseudochelatococcus lubricantis]|uniref:Uncharacterized protein n=1 Tax=Pseudochelatococcus lubricantis TaxID=1538102 RepID=A0ABX0UYI3_9HYPH|nr:hypothetical protein [Pseudochelatococcus lubricantis]NIJ56934.1 hypothetical protein [Pseudochelatococcus lubricantis]
METEFKEKTYEKYFSHEVARLTNVTFSPDPCDEALLGFDDAFWLPLPRIMRRAPFVRRRRWSRMTGVEICELDHIADQFSCRMPPFRFNLFVQYKRPVFLKTKGAGEWEHWKRSYYRYNTTPHQQDALERIEAKGNGRAATVYASPAFWQSADLWANVEAETIIDNSNIASVGRLKGHGRYSYDSPGFRGKGHSEVTDIESPAFNNVITRGLEGEPLPFNVHIKQAAKIILEAIRSSDSGAPLFEQARAALGINTLEDGTLAGAFATIEVFSDVFGASYMAVG